MRVRFPLGALIMQIDIKEIVVTLLIVLFAGLAGAAGVYVLFHIMKWVLLVMLFLFYAATWHYQQMMLITNLL